MLPSKAPKAVRSYAGSGGGGGIAICVVVGGVGTGLVGGGVIQIWSTGEGIGTGLAGGGGIDKRIDGGRCASASNIAAALWNMPFTFLASNFAENSLK